ncbi:MAG: type II toxin-antitoxin system VapC family toxin [Gemmataceae bacterium]|nr:type II toxin-antitoxin system VapC family toxin [Gemmataceae bacterium]
MLDPQVDTNVLIGLVGNVQECVAFAASHKSVGLSYNEATAAEFLAQGTAADLQSLEDTYGVRRIEDVSRAEIDTCAALLQQAFRGDPTGRTLHWPDACVVATAYLKNEALATRDLQLFKRGRDLGLQMMYVGTGAAAMKAQVYAPRPVSTHKP